MKHLFPKYRQICLLPFYILFVYCKADRGCKITALVEYIVIELLVILYNGIQTIQISTRPPRVPMLLKIK